MSAYGSISLIGRLGLCLTALSLISCSPEAEDGRFFSSLADRLTQIEIEDTPAPDAAPAGTEPAPDTGVLKTAGRTLVSMALEMAQTQEQAAPVQRTAELIRIVGPLDLPEPEADTVLETGLEAETRPASFRTIQLGSFSSDESARLAWAGFQARHPGLRDREPVMQAVTLPSGESVVRLRLGPVADDAGAKRLCTELDIADTWCARAG